MSIERGYLFKCDRCGHFRYVEDEEAYRDRNVWLEVHERVLCPRCATDYRAMIREFFRNTEFTITPYKGGSENAKS